MDPSPDSDFRASGDAARFRQLAEAIPVQVWTATPDGMLDFVTESVALYAGRTAASLLGAGWAEIIHPDDVARAGAAWGHSISTGEKYEVEFRVYSVEHAGYRWHLVRANPLLDDAGTITHWFGTNTDIEEHKRTEAARDAALAEAQQANLAKLEFLALVSHELRTPLNAIGGYAQLMLEGIPTSPSDAHIDYLRRIEQSQRFLVTLIDDVLTHAKITAGRISYRIADVPLPELLESLDHLTAPQRNAKRIAFDCSGCNSDMVLRSDREKTLQILLNLVSNSVKFTPAGGNVSVSTLPFGNSQAAIAVRDDGTGMTAEQIALVFEPYVQFDNGNEGSQKGTGLGMPISRELARAMGGDLIVDSTPGIGSLFTLILPLSADEPVPGS